MRKETFTFILKLVWLFSFAEYVLGILGQPFNILFFMKIFYFFNIPLLIIVHIWGLLFFWELKWKTKPAKPSFTWIDPEEETSLFKSSDGHYAIEPSEGVFKIYCNKIYLGFELTAEKAKKCCEEHSLNPYFEPANNDLDSK